MPNRIAYMPLSSYPEAPPDAAILASMGFGKSLGCGLHVAIFGVDIPPVASPMGSFLINVEGMALAAEARSKAESDRLQTLVEGEGRPGMSVQVTNQQVMMGAALDVAASEARYFDLALLPWSTETLSTQDMAQSLVFGSGIPVILVPPTAPQGPVDHIAIAWDGSRVAARALNDALPLLAVGGRVSVLTVHGEKALSGSGLAQKLVYSLTRRGYEASAVDLALNSRSIDETLQDAAIAAGAQLLAMGGFGHSRLRDFILGGATKGVLEELRLPTLLAH